MRYTGQEKKTRRLSYLIDGTDDLEKFILRQVLEGKFPLGGVTGVSLTQDRVAIPGNDLARVQGLPGEVRDGLLVDGLAFRLELLLQVQDPAQHFLVGQSVQRPRQGIQTGRVREVRVGQSAAHL